MSDFNYDPLESQIEEEILTPLMDEDPEASELQQWFDDHQKPRGQKHSRCRGDHGTRTRKLKIRQQKTTWAGVSDEDFYND